LFSFVNGGGLSTKEYNVESVESAFSKLLKTMEVIDDGVVTKAL
jgi:hypothetical protein